MERTVKGWRRPSCCPPPGVLLTYNDVPVRRTAHGASLSGFDLLEAAVPEAKGAGAYWERATEPDFAQA